MKKIILGLIIALSVVLSVPCLSAYASEAVTDLMVQQAKEKNYGYDNFVIVKEADDYYLCVEVDSSRDYGEPYNLDNYLNKPWSVVYEGNSDMLVSPSAWYYATFPYDFSQQKWSDYYEYKEQKYTLKRFEVVYSTFDVLYSSSYPNSELAGTPFFVGAPVPMTKLAEILEQATQRLSPMTQVVLLIPLLISLVVSFLGFRKCFQMLRTLLSRS